MTVARHYRLIDATAQPQDAVADVALRMRRARIDCAPVLDERGRLLGLVTARDLALEVLGAAKDPATTPVQEVMRRDIPTVTLDAPLDEALERMREHRTQRLLVVDDHKTLFGILWLYDVANAIVGSDDEGGPEGTPEFDDGQLVAVRARDIVILRRPPATVVQAMERLEAARAVEALGPLTPPPEPFVMQRRPFAERHVCRGRWCRGGPDCERQAAGPAADMGLAEA